MQLYVGTHRCLVTILALDNMLVSLVANIYHGTTNAAWYYKIGRRLLIAGIQVGAHFPLSNVVTRLRRPSGWLVLITELFPSRE